jgi:hypothetical protein
MNQTPTDTLPPEAADHYTMVLAEVLFVADDGGVNSRRVQFFAASDITFFPAHRLRQIQNTAANKVKAETGGGPAFQVLEVYLLNLTPLGQMTNSRFWEGIEVTKPNQVPAEPVAANETPVAEDAPLDIHSATVTPIR